MRVVAIHIVVLVLWITSIAQAENLSCAPFTSPQNIVQCAMVRSPEIRASESSMRQGEALGLIAKQIPNPEFHSKAVAGNVSDGGSVVNAEVGLALELELGGKKGARLDKAEANRQVIAAKNLSVREQVYINTWLTLYRLRQLNVERALMDATLQVYARIEKQYRQRPTLSSEQRATLQVLEIAAASEQLRRASFENEVNSNKHELEHAIGQELSINPKLLPSSRESWPTLSDLDLTNGDSGSAFQLVSAELKVAHKDLSLSESEAWPNLKIGPTFERQTEGGITYNAFGVTLSMPLPLFNLNSGQRTYANLGVARAEELLQAQRIENHHQLELLFTNYRNQVQALGETLTPTQVEERTHKIASAFDRGTVSAPMLIESRRQSLEFIRNRNAQELATIEALGHLYAYKGLLFERDL